MLYARIPTERIGVLIGPGGETKTRLHEASGVIVIIDSLTGEVTIDESRAKDPAMALQVRDIVLAVGRGFSEERAFRLLHDDTYLEVLDIKDFAHSRNRIAQIKARLIGTRGKTRRLVEELTSVDMSVYGHTVALIGESFHLGIARGAVTMLLRGSEHNTVYRFLERKREAIKAYEMGL
ncbi:MAG: KH domain-containing protein [Candidatus Thermoplasmatota archaeon]